MTIDDRVLQMMFSISKGQVTKIFWTVCYIHSSCASPLSRRWVTLGITNQMKDDLYTHFDNKSQLYLFLQDRILDPDYPARNRRAFIVNIDTTLIEVENSRDFSYQRSVFSYKGMLNSTLFNGYQKKHEI